MFPFLVTVNKFNGGAKGEATPDTNGLMPILLEGQNGELPERARVLSGTIAKNAGLEPGNIYLVKLEETGTSQWGPTYRHSVISKVSVIEYAKIINELPKGQVVVKTPVVIDAETESVTGKFK